MSIPIFRCALAAALLGLCGNASADGVGVSDDVAPLTLTEALAFTVERNPALVAFGYQIEAQQQRINQARFGPAPSIGLQTENVFRTAEQSQTDIPQTTLSLSWVFERGKADRRVDVSTAGLALAQTDADVKRLDVAAETARRFLDCLDAQARLEQVGRAVVLSEKVVTAMESRVAAGGSRASELALAKAQLARLQLQQEDAEHVLRVALRRLAAQWGDAEPSMTRVAGDYRELPAPVEFSELVARVEANPDVARYLNEQRLREAELSLKEAQTKSDWQFNVGVRRFERTSEYAMVAGISVPLYSSSRKQSNVAESRARLAQVEADSRAARLRIETELYAFYEELNHSLHRVEVLREAILPEMQLALQDAERAYEAGRFAYFQLTLIQADVLDVQAELIEASIDAHRIAVEIERLTGVTLAATPVAAEDYP